MLMFCYLVISLCLFSCHSKICEAPSSLWCLHSPDPYRQLNFYLEGGELVQCVWIWIGTGNTFRSEIMGNEALKSRPWQSLADKRHEINKQEVVSRRGGVPNILSLTSYQRYLCLYRNSCEVRDLRHLRFSTGQLLVPDSPEEPKRNLSPGVKIPYLQTQRDRFPPRHLSSVFLFLYENEKTPVLHVILSLFCVC